VESKTHVFPLFFDIDFKHDQHDLHWLKEQILPAICRGLLNALATECTKVSFLLSTAPTIPCDMGRDKQGYKSRAHVHFLYARSKEGKLLDVIVDEDRAMGIRKVCIEELTKQHGNQMDWETIVDPTVLKDNVSHSQLCKYRLYTACRVSCKWLRIYNPCQCTLQSHIMAYSNVQGLRMLFQNKAAPCMPCKKLEHTLEKDAGPCPMGEQHYYRCKCPRCTSINATMRRGQQQHGCSFGKVVNTRQYMPAGQYTYNRSKDSLRLNPAADYSVVQWDPLEMLQLASVRLPSTDKRSALKIKVPTVSRHLESQLASHSRKRKKGDPKTIMLPRAQNSSTCGTELTGTDPRIALVKQMLDLPEIKATYPDAVTDLHRVVRLGESAIKLFFVTGYCHNHKGAHASNRTYFFVAPGRVSQHCYDEDCRGYKNIMKVDTPNGLFV